MTPHSALWAQSEPLISQHPSRWKTGIFLRFGLVRLIGHLFCRSLERGRLDAPEKPSHPSLGDIGEKPNLGSIAIKRCSGPSGIVSAGNLASPRCTGGQIKEIEPSAKNSARKHECGKHQEAQTTHGGRSIHAAFIFLGDHCLFYHVWGHSPSSMVRKIRAA